jgi:hypothetical protein
MNRAFNRLVNALTNVALDDTQCGFKAFRAPVAKLLFHCSVTERFAFDVEILSLARRFGLVIDEVPVQWLRVQGSQIRPWTDARSMAGDVIRTRRRAGSGTPVPALTLQWEDEADADACASALAGPGVLPVGLPLFRQGAGSVVVLCPLASDADVDEAAGRMAARCPGGTLARTAMTVAQLSAGAPLSLLWSGAGMAPDTAVRPPH